MYICLTSLTTYDDLSCLLYKPLLQIRNTPSSWQGGGRQSGLSDAAFFHFLCEQLTETQTAQAAGELSLVLLHIV